MGDSKISNPILQVLDLSLDFKGFQVLDVISFDLKRHSFISFVGPSGCGKTSLLNAITGINKNYSGVIRLNATNISFVFQKDSLLEWLTTSENILMPLEISGKKITIEDNDKAKELLNLVGLSGYENYFPYQLSGGMKKRVEIARSLINSPDLLILDEPFSQLDIMTRERLNILIKNIYLNDKISVILVTHSVEEACFLSDKVYVMSNRPGRVILEKEILNKNDTVSYLLNATQQDVNFEIRQFAKSLWLPDKITDTDEDVKKNKFEFKSWLKMNSMALLFPFVLMTLFIILEGGKALFKVEDFIFPHPYKILLRFIKSMADPYIYKQIWATVLESLGGFSIAFIMTFIMGISVAKSRVIRGIFMPFLVIANTIPTIALAPFLVLWFGFGYIPKVLTASIVVFFPMLINNIQAIAWSSEKLSDILKFYKPSFLLRFFKFELPQSLPIIFSGITVSVTLSVIGAVVGEFISGDKGLGALVGIARSNFDSELMFVALIWLSILSLTYYGLTKFIYKIIIGERK
jgi:NitT/TauT family transport system ATP-binding protein